jgi:hypothetical protein
VGLVCHVALVLSAYREMRLLYISDVAEWRCLEACDNIRFWVEN